MTRGRIDQYGSLGEVNFCAKGDYWDIATPEMSSVQRLMWPSKMTGRREDAAHKGRKILKPHRHLAVCLSIAVLAACGGSDDVPTSSNDPLPLAVGNQWTYKYTRSWHNDGTSTYKVTGTTSVDGSEAFVVFDDLGLQTGSGGPHTTPYVAGSSGVLRYPASDATPQQQADGPQIALRLPLTPGDRWINVSRTVDVGCDYDEDGTNEVEVTESHSAVSEPVSMSTFAGSFSTAYPIETQHRRQVRSPVSGEVFDTELDNIKEWYVIGVGVVRRETYFQPYGGWRDYHTTEILSAYDIK